MNTGTRPRIRPVGTSAEIHAAAELVATAFLPLAANAYLVPDPAERLAITKNYFWLHIAHAANGAGEVWAIDNPDYIQGRGAGLAFSAVTVWLDHTGPPTAPQEYDTSLLTLTGRFQSRFAELDRLFDAHHPADRPHLYGMLFAVDPAVQGRGYGTRLIRHTLDRLDRDGVDAYLEATGTQNRELYRRLGFHDLPGDLRLGDGTRFYPMWRRPQPISRETIAALAARHGAR